MTKEILVDTVLYNPSIEVTDVDKQNKTVKVKELFENGKESTKRLIESKQHKGFFFFRVGRRTYWLHSLFIRR